jgi:hypothetical protein
MTSGLPVSRRTMVLGLLVGAMVGAVSGVVETLSSRWAESVGDHWIVTGGTILVVASFWVVTTTFARLGRLTRGIKITVVFVVIAYAMLGVVQNLVELVSMSLVDGGLGLVFLFFTIVLGVSCAILGVRAWRAGALPRSAAIVLIVAPLCTTIPIAPALQAIGMPVELFHVVIFAGPLAVAIAMLRQADSADARSSASVAVGAGQGLDHQA